MLHQKTILIVDENAHSALDLASAIKGQRGIVAGPVASRTEALATLADIEIHAAVVDADSVDARELIQYLADAQLPFVVHAAGPIGHDIARTAQGGAALFRPVDPSIIMTMVAIAIDKSERDAVSS